MYSTPVAPHTGNRAWRAEQETRRSPTRRIRSTEPLIAWRRLAIVATVAAWLGYLAYTVLRAPLANESESFQLTTEAISYLIVVTFLAFSTVMCLVAHQETVQRPADRAGVPRTELDSHFGLNRSSLTVLVPSHGTDPEVVRATLWSAALQEYPDLRVVLLLDDQPHPSDAAAAARLDETRAIGQGIADALEGPRLRFTDEMRICAIHVAESPKVKVAAVYELAASYRWAAGWLFGMADGQQVTDHLSPFFADQVLGGLGDELSLIGTALQASADRNETPTAGRMLELHRRLTWTFSARLDTFERKRFASLSQENTKAMNLDAYIGLMGGRFARDEGPDGTTLRPVHADADVDLAVPDADYLLTLDDDSLLLRDYCLRLVYLLEQPWNAHAAVT